MKRIISPSMLAADFGHLERATRMVDESAAEWVHIDVMDGVFVPNISFGFLVMRAIRRATDKFMDTHLMIVEPERYVARFAEAGANLITVHHEAVADMDACIELIRQAGAKVGVSLKPATPVSVLAPYLERLDLVLIMSVEPGFGGQHFIEGSVAKVRELRRMIDERGLATLIEIDGGISAANAGEMFSAGCNVLVAGSAIFGSPDPKNEIYKMLNV
jgi:ribulose-phosphate 3-epimerase